jgi:hypothetical protein
MAGSLLPALPASAGTTVQIDIDRIGLKDAEICARSEYSARKTIFLPLLVLALTACCTSVVGRRH